MRFAPRGAGMESPGAFRDVPVAPIAPTTPETLSCGNTANREASHPEWVCRRGRLVISAILELSGARENGIVSSLREARVVPRLGRSAAR